MRNASCVIVWLIPHKWSVSKLDPSHTFRNVFFVKNWNNSRIAKEYSILFRYRDERFEFYIYSLSNVYCTHACLWVPIRNWFFFLSFLNCKLGGLNWLTFSFLNKGKHILFIRSFAFTVELLTPAIHSILFSSFSSHWFCLLHPQTQSNQRFI